MREGLYKVHFRTPRGEGAGVVVIAGGRVRGGDSLMYYVGDYKLEDGQFSADIAVDVYARFAAVQSVLGMDRAIIHLSGPTTDDAAQLDGRVNDAAMVSFHANLTLLDG